MSVLIKGMEMPTDYSVIVKIFPDGRVGMIPYVQWFKVDLIPGTQAVPVPPHGDLVDRDKLEKDIDKYIGGEESRSRFHHWVQVQRTVIPESEEAHT